jgi:D-amino-acid dehydrogenase
MVTHNKQVIIIGGGVVGVCCLYYLAKEGWDVALIERDHICAGCSYGNAGLLVPGHSIPLAQPGVIAKGLRWLLEPESPFHIKFRPSLALISWLLKFRKASNIQQVRRSLLVLRDLISASMDLYKELAAIEHFDFGYHQMGVLGVFLTERGLAEGIEEAHLLQEVNVGATVLNATATLALEPNLNLGVVGSVSYTDDAHMVPDLFVKGLKGIAENMGARIYSSTEVTGFKVADQKITVVETSRGSFHAREVVLAAGSWSPMLGQALQLKLPIQPAKGYSVTCELPLHAPRVPLLLAEARVAVTPIGNKLRFAGGLEFAGFDFTINQRRVRAMMKSSVNYLAIKEPLVGTEPWRGLRPCTPDGLPIIARPKRINNLIVATGHGMLGMTLGPVTGLLVSQLAARERPMLGLSPFMLER